MLILKDRKRVNVKDIFPNATDLINHIKNENDKINFSNPAMLELAMGIYSRMVNDDGLIKFSRFSRWYPKEFGFKKKNILQLEFWLERGWSQEYAKETITTIKSERGVIAAKTRLKNKSLIDFSSATIVKFKGAKFTTDTHPTCNTCNSKLELKKINIRNERDNYYYQVKKCSNVNCQSHNMSKYDQYRSYLPTQVAEKKIDELTTTINETNRLCVDYWIKRGYSEKDSITKIAKIQSENSKLVKNRFIPSKENLRKNGYTPSEIREICLTPANVDFWIKKGFDYNLALKKVSKHQSHASKQVDYDKRLLPSNIEYWINKGYNHKDAKSKVSEHQKTFSKEICIKKYGKEQGVVRFTERQQKWNNSLIKNGNLKCGYSKISQELFYTLLNEYAVEYKCDIKFATHNGEFKLDKESGGIWLYDFTDIRNKKIIEYNGDDYHANPKKYLAEDNPHPFRKNITAKEIWNKDQLKIGTANKNGYDVLIIWDSEYRWGNKEKVIERCLQFLNKK